MKIGLDTSVLLRLLVGEPADLFKRAQACLDEISRRGDQVVVSDLVAAEIYFALQHHYGVSKRDALAFLSDAFASGEVKGTGMAEEVLTIPNLATAKPGFVDRLIHATYLAEAEGMVTFEKASARLKSVRIL